MRAAGPGPEQGLDCGNIPLLNFKLRALEEFLKPKQEQFTWIGLPKAGP